MRGPLEGRNGFFARELDRELARGLQVFDFRDFERAFADACAQDMDLARSLSAEELEAVAAEEKPADILAALHEAQSELGADGMSALCNKLIVRSGPLSTREERASEIRACQVEMMGKLAAGVAMQRHGLPASFAVAVGHHPEVEALARERLGSVSPMHIPDGREVFDALSEAVEKLLEEHLPLLQELAVMAQNPPVKLDPPLTPETMPRYINAMMFGDVLLEPLLHDGAPLDEFFLDRLVGLTLSLDAATHAMEGDFGARDRNAVLGKRPSLILARRGVAAADAAGNGVARGDEVRTPGLGTQFCGGRDAQRGLRTGRHDDFGKNAAHGGSASDIRSAAHFRHERRAAQRHEARHVQRARAGSRRAGDASAGERRLPRARFRGMFR